MRGRVRGIGILVGVQVDGDLEIRYRRSAGVVGRSIPTEDIGVRGGVVGELCGVGVTGSLSPQLKFGL